MDELSKAKKAFDDAQALVDKLLVDLGKTVPGTAAYISIQKKYDAAEDDRDVKKNIYDPLKKANDRAATAQAQTAADATRNKALLQQAVNAQIPTVERMYKSAEKTYKADPKNPNKITAYLNAMTALNSAYAEFEKQGIVFNRLVIQQNDGTVLPAGTPAAAVEAAPVVTPAAVPATVSGTKVLGRKERGESTVPVPVEPPPPPVSVAKPKKVVFTRAEVDAKLAELKLADTPENRKVARQNLKAGTTAAPVVEDKAWEEIFKKNYPTYAWMFTDLDRTKYADVFELFKFAQDNEMPAAEFDRRFRGTSFDRELEQSQKGRELAASIGNFTWGSGQLAKFLTKAINFGYTGENLKQKAYIDLFSKVGDKYVNDLAVGEVRASSPYLALKRIGTQFLTSFNDQTVEDALVGDMTADDLLRKSRDIAKAMYPHLKDSIDAGVTLEDLSANYKQIAARTLELDPSQVDMGLKFNEALNYTKGGQARMLSLGEWETELRTNDKYRYRFTKQANQDATDIGLSIARAFGKVQ